jgi:uncharacterized membrane protein YsdA (DUF1294 family)
MSKIATVIVLWLVLNGYALLVMKADKEKAKRHQWRTPERRMFVLAFLGGAIGIYAGMQIFHHKTKHLRFLIFIPLLILWNLFLIVWVVKYLSI